MTHSPTPYYAEVFAPMAGRCFGMVSGGSEGGGPTHCPEPPTWRGTFRARSGPVERMLVTVPLGA